MSEEKVITLNEFKTVMEEIKSQNRRTIEVIQGYQEQTKKGFVHLEGRMDKLEGRMDKMEGRMNRMDGCMDRVEGSLKGVKEQVGRLTEKVGVLSVRVDVLTERVDDLKVLTSQLQEGQAEIKASLADKVTRGEFVNLEKRVIRLERKAV